MSVHKKQHITLPNPAETQAPLEAVLPGPESFHDYLRGEIRQATRLVMEEIMREELTQFLGAKWGEITSERKGYRNGFYTRELGAVTGDSECA